MNDFNLSSPASINESLEKISQHQGNQFIAGGTNIIDLLKYNILRVHELIDVNGLKNNAISRLKTGGVLLDAFVTNAETAYHPIIESQYPLLTQAILAGASAQIRNMATNGGNLLQRTRCYYFYDVHTPCNKREPGSGCSAIDGYNRNLAILGTSEHCIAVFPSDMCVALAALDAKILLSSQNGARELNINDFHRLPEQTPEVDNNLQPGELITGIELPESRFDKHFNYLKLRDRNSYAFAMVSVATAMHIEKDTITDIRIALGGVAAKPWRKVEAEQMLIGQKPTRENFEQAAELIVHGAVAYRHNAFKITLAKRAIVRSCLMALHQNNQITGAQPS